MYFVDAKAATNGQRNGWSRPVALPDDLGSPGLMPERGVVTLPANVFWSGPERRWDLGNRRQRIQVYEMVLAEGTEDDVRRFIDIDELVRLWPELWLPPHVRAAWSTHLRKLRGLDLAC
jgi:hypothetical protein